MLAAKLAKQLGGVQSLHPQVRKYLESVSCRRVLVAVSGGVDSVCTICYLWALREQYDLELIVGHYNHGWRGMASEEDAKFVELLADSLGCTSYLEHCVEKAVSQTETVAREFRMDFLRRVAAEEDCACIVFGHQANDILETQLLRLARGSGLEGLAAPRPVHYFNHAPTHLRPLLAISSATIFQAMETVGLPWREDRSNQNREIARNALRHEVVPVFAKSVDRDIVGGAVRSQYLLEEDAVALQILAKEQLPGAFSGDTHLDRKVLCSVPVALARRAVAAWLLGYGLMDSVSAASMDALLEAIRGQVKCIRHSVRDVFIVADANYVSVEREVRATPIDGIISLIEGENLTLPNGAILTFERIDVDPKLQARLKARAINSKEEAYLSAEAGDRLSVRAWEPGDRFRPLGAPGEKKLKEWFLDRQIPLKERRDLPIVIGSSGEIFWVPGLAPADNKKILQDTKQALRLTYQLPKTT
ncbi:MAG: tRNA lysidine(34) synthetase TilS [Coraliomargaritaceae bacterium]